VIYLGKYKAQLLFNVLLLFLVLSMVIIVELLLSNIKSILFWAIFCIVVFFTIPLVQKGDDN